LPITLSLPSFSTPFSSALPAPLKINPYGAGAPQSGGR
jgi:hypothetical protein